MTVLQWLVLLFVGPVCLVAPGYMLRGAFAGPARSQAAPWWMVAFEVILASALWTGAWGILLLQLRIFSPAFLIAGNLLLSAALAVVVRYRGRNLCQSVRRFSRTDWMPLVLVIVAVALFFQPHEFIYGGADAGVYVSLARSIVRHGSWEIREPVIADLPESLYPALFRQQPPTYSAEYIHLPGFYLTAPSTGGITPQFYPLHPLWLAIAQAVGGVRMSLYVTPLWGVLGAAAVALVAGSLFGGRCAVTTFLLLALTATQIWFSRYPTTEVLTQFLVFAGLWALMRYGETGTGWHAVLSGAALGQATVARLDVYFLAAIPVLLGLYRMIAGLSNRRDWLLVGAFGVGVAQSLVFALTQSRPYFDAIYAGPIARLVAQPWLVVAAAMVIVAVAWMIRWWRRLDQARQRAWLASAAIWWRRGWRVLSVVIVLAAAYAYFLRPVVEDTSATWHYWYGDSDVPNVEPYNLVRLGWYLTPLGLLLAVGGLRHIMRQGPDSLTTVFLSVGLFFSVLFIIRSRNNPHHIYVMRRYVPVVIPFLVTMMAYALDRVLRRGIWGRVSGGIITLVLVVWLVSSAWLQIIHIEYDGLISQVDVLVDGLGSSPAIILFNDDLAVSTGALLGTPLHYLYGYSVVDLQEEHVDPLLLAAQVDAWRADGTRVLLADGPRAVEEVFSQLVSVPLARFDAIYPVLEVSYEHRPRTIWRQTMDVSFSEVVETR